MKTKILAVSHYYATDNRGGGEIMLHEILKRLVQEGYEVDAVATDYDEGFEIYEGVNVYKGKSHLKKINYSYSLIITQFQNAHNVLTEAKRLGIPSVYIVHNNMNPTTFIIDRHKPSLIIFNTHWIQDFYKYEGNSMVVHPPVYAEQHKTTPGDSVTLINLIPSKGAYTFYNMAQLFPRTKFLAVKGGYYKNQQVIMRKPNVAILENTQNMKRDVWSKTKILLMPSQYESYGMAAVEALASGIPVIANPTPGLKESLGYAGIFPANTTIGAWRRALRNLQIPSEYERASKMALRRSQEINPRAELNEMAERIKEIL